MIGICIELKTKCKFCSNPLMINAFTEDILCSSCNKTNSFDPETWVSLLESAIKEAPRFKIGEGQPSTIFRGEYSYNLTYGRQQPRCGKCKQDIDATKLEEYSTQKSISCSKCQNPVFIRKPSELIKKCFSSVKYLAGEDDDLLSVNTSEGKLPASSKPVLFTCPACAGNLQIDGTDRMIECKFCDSQIFLPDDLWFRLHPAKSVERWYMIFDIAASGRIGGVSGGSVPAELPKWYYLSDVVSDRKGNIYIASAEDSDEDFILWSITKDRKVRWIRNGLKFSHEDTGIALANDGSLYLWDKGKHSLLKISSKDGSIISKINGKPKTKEEPYAFNMKGCCSLVSCPDDSILAFLNNEIARFDTRGNRIQLWKGRKFGLFSSEIGNVIPDDGGEWAPYIKDIGSFPKRINSDFTKVLMGYDNYLYLLDRSSSDGEIAKFDMDGSKLWTKYIPLNYKDCKPCTDSSGRVYILGRTENSNTNLLRYDPSRDNFQTLLTDVREGGVLYEENTLAVLPDGTVFIMKYYNRMKVFSNEMKLLFRSEQSKADDEEVMQKKKEKIENDEEFE
jgi:hypothetical protein